MTYPDLFLPDATERFIVDASTVPVPKCNVLFRKWQGEPLIHDFGRKPVIDYSGQPLFAELAIRQRFAEDGWEARWVETYGTRPPKCLTAWKDDAYRNQEHVPFADEPITRLLADIARENGSYSGCWDVVAKKGELVIFAESKRSKKDAIRESQQGWLRAALQCGLRPEHFLLVQWDFVA
ncbi:hypothetical protein [Flaviaesturariibacter amylovorans]|uniref:VRR-NUC domain-containing protein n=1 Tax=Flaviaesturariibacter amylovorans TaxID=1084520 RepID=A0ABP8GJF9_9BACT